MYIGERERGREREREGETERVVCVYAPVSVIIDTLPA
jgi:hypothetical protein